MNVGSGKALFLDRDGTLIFDKDYLADPAEIDLVPGVANALRRARTLGYQFFLFTNQSGIGRGYHTLADAEAVNVRMEEMLGLPAPLFTGICIAPEIPSQPSRYRKPSPRLILESITRFSLDPQKCWMVGDRESDMNAGLSAGICSAVVGTGKYTVSEWRSRTKPGVPVFADLAEFVATLD